MRNCWIILLALCVTATAVAAEPRLNLLPGHQRPDWADAAPDGFRIVIDDRVALWIAAEGPDQARIVGPGVAERIIDLTSAPDSREFLKALATPSTTPRFVSEDFTTFHDAVSVLVQPLRGELGGRTVRLEARVHLATERGRVGQGHVTGVQRGARLPDAAVDGLLERLLSAGALPPLAAGRAACDVAIAVEADALTIWVGRPFIPGAVTDTPLSAGFPHRESLDWPQAVVNSPLAAPAIDLYRQERHAAREWLTARLNEGGPALYGTWRLDVPQAWDAVGRGLAVAPPGDAEPLLLVGARVLVHRRRPAQALRYLDQIIAGGAPGDLTDQAKRLRRVLAGGLWLEPPPAPVAADGLLASARLWHTARRLAALLVVDENGDTLRDWTNRRDPEAPIVLYDAAALLDEAGRGKAAVEVCVALREHFPKSPVAPLAAWREVRAIRRTGDRDGATRRAWELLASAEPAYHAVSGTSARLGDRLPDALTTRAALVRQLRTWHVADFLRGGAGSELEAAERAAQWLSRHTAEATDDLAWGEILLAAGRADQAQPVFRAVADGDDNAARDRALRDFGAVLSPDARRVAAALSGDPAWSEVLSPLLAASWASPFDVEE